MMTFFTTLNIPVTAPIASASVPTQVTRNPGVRRSARHAWRRSRQRVLDGREALRVIEAILRDADVAEVASRGVQGFFRGDALGTESLGLELDVGADLVLEVALGAAA